MLRPVVKAWAIFVAQHWNQKEKHMSAVTVEIDSVSPMLQDPLTKEKIIEISKGSGGSKPSPDTPPEKIAEGKIYRDEKGRPGVPSLNVMACLKAAGKKVKLNGKAITMSDNATILYSLLSIKDVFLQFINVSKWVLDVRAGRNSKGQAIAIFRPRFDKWALRWTMIVDDNLITLDSLRLLVDAAGEVGLCAFRSTCGGPFGRFRVKKWSVTGAPKKVRTTEAVIVPPSDGNGSNGKTRGRRTKLSEKQRETIRKNERLSVSELAEKYGVSVGTIYNVKKEAL